MKCIYAVVAFLTLHVLVHAQEFQFFATRDGVDIASKYGENAVTLQFKNKNNQKVYVSTGDVLWFQGEIMVGKANGGGLTLAPGETSSFGMFFIYPNGYDSKNYQSLRFRISSIKVEIGGMGNDPRYQKAQTKSKNSTVVGGQGLPEIDYNKGATREPGSNEWKPLPPTNEIKFPGDKKPADQKKNTTSQTTDKVKPSNNQSPDPNIKMNGLYYSNGTATQNNVTANNTENENQKQQYQYQADNYLNKAQDKNQSSISQNLNLDLAKTNAMMAGNQQQVQEIQQRQNQQRYENKVQMANSLVDLGNSVFNLINSAKQRKLENQAMYDSWRQQAQERKIEEQRRKEEEELKKSMEILRQFGIDSSILTENNRVWKTSKISENLDSVFYIGYKRNYGNNEATPITLKAFVVHRYNDGTFPLFLDVIKKSKHESHIDLKGITLLIGYFGSEKQLNEAIFNIQKNASVHGYNTVIDQIVRAINYNSNIKDVNKDFWNQ